MGLMKSIFIGTDKSWSGLAREERRNQPKTKGTWHDQAKEHSKEQKRRIAERAKEEKAERGRQRKQALKKGSVTWGQAAKGEYGKRSEKQAVIDQKKAEKKAERKAKGFWG